MSLAEQLTTCARAVFGATAVIKHERFAEPASGTYQLFVVVETALPLDEADALLRRLEDDWWLDNMPENGSVALELRLL